MLSEWTFNTISPFYKSKEDIQNCNNYKGIKLLSHTMKLWQRAIKRRLRKHISLSENEFDFVPGRLAMEVIHLL